MDLGHYDTEELLLTAMKSEVESKNLYQKLCKKTQNGLLQDKFDFLAKEEEKHRFFIEEIYKNHYPKKTINLPEKSAVPMPEVVFDDDTPLSKILGQAEKAEQAASDFYKLLSERFEKGSKIHNTLMYFSDMEIGHKKMLEMEKQSMERYEEDEVYWPMIHVGP